MARSDTSLSRKQKAKGDTKAAKFKGKSLGKVQPTLRDTGLNSPRRELEGPVSKPRADVKLGSNPDSPLKGPVGKTYTPDPSFVGSGKGRKKGSYTRQRGVQIKKRG